MRKVIAAINMTIDGVCDHTAGLPDEEIHQHYADLLNSSDIILYGRTTFQLMQYWQSLLKKPSGDKTADNFATFYLLYYLQFKRHAIVLLRSL